MIATNNSSPGKRRSQSSSISSPPASLETLATVTAANVRSRRTIITLGGLLLPDANLPAAAGGYQSITLNGQTTTLNWSLGHGTAGSWYGLTVNFQMDGNYQQSSYNVYLDNLTLSYQ